MLQYKISALLFLLTICVQVNSQIFNDEVFKFGRVLELIEKSYVDTVNTKDLVEEAIVSMLKELDPHSIYISSDDLKEMNESLRGNFEGIGVQFSILKDTILVVAPISGGPSEKLGILAGDRIVEIEGENVAGIGITNKDVMDKLRGKKGTKVTVGIKRRGEEELIDVEIIRDKIPIFSLDAAYMVDDKIGYIKLNRFAATTMDEYKKALEELKPHGVEHLILDLRGNSGGYLNMAIKLSDEFLENDKMIVYTKGVNKPYEDHRATSQGNFKKGKVVVLVDEGSASASEIVSGAIQDWDKGIIIGRRTFGKGLVQKQYSLNDGSAIRLTTARYYTPTGRAIQKSYSDGNDAYSKDVINRYNNGELTNKDSIHFPDSLKYRTKVFKRAVYGGGGIMPDIFIPMDTTKTSKFYRDVVRKGIINRFVLDLLDKERDSFTTKYADIKQFKSEFVIDTVFFNKFVEYAKAEGVEKQEEDGEDGEEENVKSIEDMSLRIKALIARDIWSTSEYFEVVNDESEAFNKAVEILQDKKKFRKQMLKK